MRTKKSKKIEDKILKKISGGKHYSQYFIILKTLYRFFKRNYLKIRSVLKTITSQKSKTENIYHASVQKTGSQWIKRIFRDKRIKKYTNLSVYPQHEYEYGKFHKKFPKHTFVPGLYLPYHLYEEIKKPKRYKTFYITRDPRNIVVSWYYSMLESHRPGHHQILKHRKNLRQMNLEQGISYCIRTLQWKLSFMKSWIYNSNDANVLIIKFEDLVSSPFKIFKKIFNHCEIKISDKVLKEVLADYTKEKMRKRDLNRRKDTTSHYRRKSSNWKEVFTKKNKNLFYNTTGNLVELLKYEK